MPIPTSATAIADEIITLYNAHGHAEYAGEKVSQLEHMAQSAQLAAAQEMDDTFVLAAFLHDIGHICVAAQHNNTMGDYGITDHEAAGADYLRQRGFSETLITLVGSHVAAKRYLTCRHPDYYAQLSEASKQTLEHQGGRMSETEATAFEQQPLFSAVIALRRIDEQAKVQHQPLPPLEPFRQMIIAHLSQQPAFYPNP
jgi:phosphonate degradation associated HDIG domain protein